MAFHLSASVIPVMQSLFEKKSLSVDVIASQKTKTSTAFVMGDSRDQRERASEDLISI